MVLDYYGVIARRDDGLLLFFAVNPQPLFVGYAEDKR